MVGFSGILDINKRGIEKAAKYYAANKEIL